MKKSSQAFENKATRSFPHQIFPNFRKITYYFGKVFLPTATAWERERVLVIDDIKIQPK